MVNNVPPGLLQQNSICLFKYVVWISEQTANISLYNINWLVGFIIETECVYCAVRTGYLNILTLTLIKIQPDATVCRYLFTAKLLYMFRVSQHPSSGVLKTVTAASSTGHNIGRATSLQRGPIRPRREEAAPVLWPVLETAVTVFNTPDDGCCGTRNMYSDFAVNKYLHTVASGWIFINIELRCTEPWA